MVHRSLSACDACFKVLKFLERYEAVAVIEAAGVDVENVRCCDWRASRDVLTECNMQDGYSTSGPQRQLCGMDTPIEDRTLFACLWCIPFLITQIPPIAM